MSGVLYGLGVGPGDPELITLKALRILQSVPHLFVTARGSRPSLAARIAAPYIDPGRQQVHLLPFPAAGSPADMDAAWRAHARRIAATVQAGQSAAFLTEGDPLFYGSFAHILTHLAALDPPVPVQVVPGVTSVTACAARVAAPLVVREGSLAVVPASAPLERIRQALAAFEGVAILKPGDRLDALLDLLAETGRLGQAVCIQRCGQPGERVVHSVAALRGQSLDYFSLILVPGGGQRCSPGSTSSALGPATPNS